MLHTYKVTSRSTGNGLQVESQARQFKVLFDEPKNAGGQDTGWTPVEALLASLGACQTIAAAAFAKSQNFTYDDMWVELEGDLDPAGFMGNENVRNGFQEIRYSLHFVTDESQDKIDAFSEFIDSRCPVSDNLQNGVQVVRTAAIKETK